MDVSLKASEKLAMEDNRYPCRARTTRVAHALLVSRTRYQCRARTHKSHNGHK